MASRDRSPATGPPVFKPTLIIHGGAGALRRSTLPPDLYRQYRASLLSYLRSTYERLQNGASALDAAVHAVSLLEDDELFNCGRGAVFTSAGTIEMESSIMVTSVRDDREPCEGAIKRGVGVIGVRNVRHPVQLAREALLRAGVDSDGNPVNDGGNPHAQLSGPALERCARDWGLEFMPDSWFWTQRRWDEHLRGLTGVEEKITMSQGTVGCVCLDQWGNLAAATSTGGLTNKIPGRIGDTPTLGAGFWAESWIQRLRSEGTGSMSYTPQMGGAEDDPVRAGLHALLPWNLLRRLCLGDCVGERASSPSEAYPSQQPTEKSPLLQTSSAEQCTRRAVALSGTGNGDSFLRVNAARTAAAMLRFSPSNKAVDLGKAVTAVAGPDGELQQSAGKRWNKTGEGQGGLIGIEAELALGGYHKGDGLKKGKVVFDFNCGGMFRAWMEDDAHGDDRERVMVFRDEYQE